MFRKQTHLLIVLFSSIVMIIADEDQQNYIYRYNQSNNNNNQTHINTTYPYLSHVLDSKSFTCNNHPAFTKAKILILTSIFPDENARNKSELVFKNFKSATPTLRNSTELGVCSYYLGQKSCCDSNIVKLIDQAALLKVKPIQQAKSAFQKLVQSYVYLLSSTCQADSFTSLTADQIFTKKNLTNFQKIRTTQKKCKINFAKAIASHTRGAMCSMCAGIDKISTYFTSDYQIKISQNSINTFQTITNDAITCTANLFTPENIESIMTEFNKNFIQNDDSCGGTILQTIQDLFAAHKIANDDGNGGVLCKGTTLFTSDLNCENILQGTSDLEITNKQQRILNVNSRLDRLLNRDLQAIDYVFDPKGINTFIRSSTDMFIDENGQNMVIQLGQVNVSISFLSNLIFKSILILVIFIY